jgi:hypothetical protein
MAQYPKIRLTILSNPTADGQSMHFYIGGLEISIGSTFYYPPGTNLYLIGNYIHETNDNIFTCLNNNYGDPFSFHVDSYNVIGITCESYDLGNFDYYIQNSADFDVEVIPLIEPVIDPIGPNLSYTFSYAESLNHNKCDFVRVNLSQSNGEYPMTINYSEYEVPKQKIADNSSELWIEIPRYYEPAQSIFVTEAGGDTLAKTVPFVSQLRPPTVTVNQDFETYNTVTINAVSTEQTIRLDYLYSFDGLIYSDNNVFNNVPVGLQTFYVKDQFGCVRSVEVDILPFQISEIYAVHNPLNFIIERSTTDEYVECNIEVNGNNIGIFRAIPYDIDNEINRYILFADEIIRANMPPFDDYTQTQDSRLVVQNMAAEIEITTVSDGALVAFFIAVNAARQIGGAGEKMLELVNNNEQPFIFVEGQPGYVYFYDNEFSREKILLTTNSDITRVGVTKSIEVLPYCPEDLIIKYLDRNGMFRFYKFHENYQVTIHAEKIGIIQTMYESIATAQGLTKNIGYKNTKELSATAYAVPDRHMNSLQDLFVSPRVYLHVGDLGLDARENWLLVDIEGDGLVKHPKRKFNDLRVSIILPDEFNISML